MTFTKELNRRDFMKLCGALSLAAAVPMGLMPLAEALAGPRPFTQTRLKMGTIVTMTVHGVSDAKAKGALEAAWTEMDRLIAVFDRHQPHTVISELNARGRLSGPGLEFFEVLECSREVHRLSEGAFDPTVLPILDLIEKSFALEGRPPDKNRITEALAKVDFSAVRFSRSEIKLGKPGQMISLDGLAKGYIVDRAGDKLKQAGLKNALINAGGDILAWGNSPAGKPWRIGIQDPWRPGQCLKVIALTDKAVATSGSYERFFDRKHDFHHLLDPKAGRPAGRLVSATVVASTAALADAMSTAVFVNPGTLKKKNHTEGMTITRNKLQAFTPGFKKLLIG